MANQIQKFRREPLEGLRNRLFWLDDSAWALVDPHLPRNQPGARRVDDRRVVSGIIHVLNTGCRWCDCPVDYGPFTKFYNRFNRWPRERLQAQGAVPVIPGRSNRKRTIRYDKLAAYFLSAVAIA